MFSIIFQAKFGCLPFFQMNCRPGPDPHTIHRFPHISAANITFFFPMVHGANYQLYNKHQQAVWSSGSPPKNAPLADHHGPSLSPSSFRPAGRFPYWQIQPWKIETLRSLGRIHGIPLHVRSSKIHVRFILDLRLAWWNLFPPGALSCTQSPWAWPSAGWALLGFAGFTPPAVALRAQGRLPWRHSPRVLVSGTEGAVPKTCLHSNHQEPKLIKKIDK